MYGIEENNKLSVYSEKQYAGFAEINIDEFVQIDETYYRKGFEPELSEAEIKEQKQKEIKAELKKLDTIISRPLEDTLIANSLNISDYLQQAIERKQQLRQDFVNNE